MTRPSATTLPNFPFPFSLKDKMETTCAYMCRRTLFPISCVLLRSIIICHGFANYFFTALHTLNQKSATRPSDTTLPKFPFRFVLKDKMGTTCAYMCRRTLFPVSCVLFWSIISCHKFADYFFYCATHIESEVCSDDVELM